MLLFSIALLLSNDTAAAEKVEWRVGLRLEAMVAPQEYVVGPLLVASVEPHFGRYRMLFELGAGASYAQQGQFMSIFNISEPVINPPIARLSYRGTLVMADLGICPLDLPLGKTGFSVLACARAAAAPNFGGMGESPLWLGANARLRWQSPWLFYGEVHVGGAYDVISDGPGIDALGSVNPGVVELGTTVGVRL